MDAINGAAVPPDFETYTAERVRVAQLVLQALKNEQVPVAFAAILAVATALIQTVSDESARKTFAQFFLADGANAAFLHGLNDEEIQKAILTGEADAKTAMERIAATMKQMMEAAGEPN